MTNGKNLYLFCYCADFPIFLHIEFNIVRPCALAMRGIIVN